MPPKPSLTGSFQVSNEAENEVICPLNNQDGSLCRKKCLGVRVFPVHIDCETVGLTFIQEKRYRSMQEHIRRAHPDFYIPKLPATEESFQLMITTPPTARPPPQQQPAVPPRRDLCKMFCIVVLEKRD